MNHSDEYTAYMGSAAWGRRRRRAMADAHSICERCKAEYAQEVHHLTYARLGNERPSDLQALCLPCHKLADQERAHNAGLDTYASKRFGDDWNLDYDYDYVVEEFNYWLESKAGYR